MNANLAALDLESVVGLDLSLTSTGKVVLDKHGDIVDCRAIRSRNTGMARIDDICGYIDDGFSPRALVHVIEGYAMGIPRGASSLTDLAELGGVVKHFLWRERRPYIVVPPATVKKYATGKGNAKKDEVRLAVYKRWGFEAPTADEVDAYVLARIGLAYAGFDKDLVAAQREVVKALLVTNGKAKSRKERAS